MSNSEESPTFSCGSCNETGRLRCDDCNGIYEFEPVHISPYQCPKCKHPVNFNFITPWSVATHADCFATCMRFYYSCFDCDTKYCLECARQRSGRRRVAARLGWKARQQL